MLNFAVDNPVFWDPLQVVIAAHTAAGLAHWAVTLEKGARQRGGEDTLASRLLLRAVAHAAGLPCDLASGLQAGKDGELQVGPHTRHSEFAKVSASWRF